MTVPTRIILFLFLINSISGLPRAENAFSLSIVHMNDFHARYEATNNDGGVCKDEACIGGFSRLYAQIKAIISEKPDSVLLNAGDNFQGTLYYSLFKWNITQYFLNQLPFDAIVLGNHEFDDGVQGAVPFIQSLNAPVVVSNINDTLEPSIQGLYKKSTVIERNGKKIGIVGVLLSHTNQIASTGKLTFFDESESVNAEAERLVREEGVFTNIILSHSGYDVEQEVARKATAESKISVIVGGHSHTFLYTGSPSPGPEPPEGPYPTIIRRDDGEQVLVLQASAYCRYLGNISVSLDDDGNILDWSGAPIFLDTTLPQDGRINLELFPWKQEVNAVGDEVIGNTVVDLDESTCRFAECLQGDFVTDAMVFSYLDLTEDDSWTYASLAVMNAGSMRNTIYQGNITYGDMVTAQPFENTFDVGEIQGRYIQDFFEYSVTQPYSYGRAFVAVNLLQVSGFHVVFDVSKPEGSRVQSIKVRCRKCSVPVYEDLDLEESYRLIVPSYLKTGGDGFTIIQDNLKNIQVGRVDIDVYVDYLKAKSPIIQEVEGRIILIGGENVEMRKIKS